MQPVRKIDKVEHYLSENVIDFKLKAVEKNRAKAIEHDREKVCFQSDERYFCTDSECSCADECKKLIAAWMR